MQLLCCLSPALSAPWDFNGLLVPLCVLWINFPVPQTVLFCHSPLWSLLTALAARAGTPNPSPPLQKQPQPQVLSSGRARRCQHPLQAQKDKTCAENHLLPLQLRVHSSCPAQNSLSRCRDGLPVWCEEITARSMRSLSAQAQIIGAIRNSS